MLQPVYLVYPDDTTGTVFIMWIGEQISDRGIGNGISLIIFAGNEGFLDDFAASNVVKFESELYPFIEASYPSWALQIRYFCS